MRIVVTGSNGQLGQDLVRFLSNENEVIGLGRQELDVCNLDKCRETIGSLSPDVIIHAAAYTAVDKAEVESDDAYRVNAYGSRNVAIAAEESGAKLCYISTDYVFDGTSQSPYSEYDNTNPQGVYGKSKRAGEILVQSLSSKFFIVRTSWVYGLHGNNFVKTMLNLSTQRNSIKVVHDQIGSPTYTIDLAKFLGSLINSEQYGIYHASNTGSCSWYEFSKAIFEKANIQILVEPCTSEEYPRPAPRPQYSVMDHMSIRTNGFEEIRDWREALDEFIVDNRSTILPGV